MPEEMKEFAASSNGDKWFLKHDDATGEQVVIHQANIASGGSETSWPLSSFLQIFGEHSQGDARRQALRDANYPGEAVRGEAAPIERTMSAFPWARRSGSAESNS